MSLTEEQKTELQQKIGWTFSDPRLLIKAVTHATFANENPNSGPDYERLEFVGDAVLGLVVAKLLFTRDTSAAEGELSRRRARVVRWETLATIGIKLDLGRFALLGEGQRKSGGISRRIIADIYEAIVGAVFLDGGYKAAEKCFSGHMIDAIDQSREHYDYKTHLQEACHRRGLSAPNYVIMAIEGPDHARQFTCEVLISGRPHGRGIASSKKTAEQVCARLALQMLNEPLDG